MAATNTQNFKFLRLSSRGVAMWVYGPPKSVQLDFLWSKNDARTAIEHEY